MTALSAAGRSVAYPTGLTILDLFCRNVGDYPDKVAVRYADEELSYRELNGKANKLAAVLRGRGIRKGDAVPVIVGNSLELPISWLALIKLGAVFVPCDPAWPVKHMTASLRQLGPRAVLASGRLDAAFGAGVDVIKVASKDLDPSDQRFDVEELSPDDLIYGFFTSGSTGQPKCALNIHRGLFNRFYYMTRHFGACEPKSVLLNSRHVFDSSVWQLLWPLTVPGEVSIPEQAGHLDIARTIDIIHRRSITMTDFVPSIFNALTELIALNPALVEKLSSLRWLLIGGEAINVKAVNKFRRLLPHVRLTNTYGPTEASIGMVFHDVDDEDGADIPLGSPIDNTFVAILDEHFRPVPPGQVGEICIGGDCLGRGYLGDPEKTRAVFIPNPVSAIPGDRLYRTGDLGRQDERGRIHFCGRLDTQAKVNGVRIELAEIEHALLRHRDVQEAVVIPVRQGALDRKKLCAFVVSRTHLSAAQLKNHLTALLPEYMLPNEFFFCPSLPLTPNGKADRQSLANSLTKKRQDSPVSKVPMSCFEEELLEQFRRALGNIRVGIDDHFFEHGGDSLSALEVTLRAKVDSDVDLEIQDIYTWPTVRELADGITRRARGLKAADIDCEAESRLADDIRVPPRSAVTPRRSILVTGATGFVGAHVLWALLRSTSLRVGALVRAADEGDAFRRCQRALARYGLWEDAFAERLSALSGDLSRPQLGLEPAAWKGLEQSTDSIVHCGAMVDFLRGYSLHRPHNVAGTLEVIRLATSQTAKHLHYVSTLSVFDVRQQDQGLIKESAVPDARNLPPGGYHQSKLVAENLVRKVRSNGLAVTIYRLGEVGPNSITGIPNSRSFLNLLLAGCVRLGTYPVASFSFDCTPVNAVANAIAYCAGNGAAAGETFHVLQRSPMSFGSVIDCLLAAGVRMRGVSYAEFWGRLEEGVRARSSSPELTLLRALLPRPSKSESLATLLTEAQRFYGRDEFDQLLQRSTISFPELNEKNLSHIATAARRGADHETVTLN